MADPTAQTVLYTDRSQIQVPSSINRLTAKACVLTNKLADWLVEELKQWQGIHGKYTRTGATTWLENTATFEELARILRERNTIVWFLEQTIEELNENLRYRREVTAFFRGYPSQVGSRFWLENNRHQHFNERVLGKVLEILIHMQDARR